MRQLHSGIGCVWHQLQQKLVQKQCDSSRGSSIVMTVIREGPIRCSDHILERQHWYYSVTSVFVLYFIFGSSSLGFNVWSLSLGTRACALCWSHSGCVLPLSDPWAWPLTTTWSSRARSWWQPHAHSVKVQLFYFQSHYSPAVLGEIEAACAVWFPPRIPFPADKKTTYVSSGSSFETFSDVVDISVQSPRNPFRLEDVPKAL